MQVRKFRPGMLLRVSFVAALIAWLDQCVLGAYDAGIFLTVELQHGTDPRAMTPKGADYRKNAFRQNHGNRCAVPFLSTRLQPVLLPQGQTPPYTNKMVRSMLYTPHANLRPPPFTTGLLPPVLLRQGHLPA